MKRLIIMLVLALALLLLGAPYVTGRIAETETLKMVEEMNRSSTEYGSTEVLNYDRGFRSTSARYKYTPPAPLDAFFEQFGEIIYICESRHGVIGIDYTCSLGGESIYSNFVSEKLDGKDPLAVFGSISAFGGFTQTVSLDPITGLEVDGATLNFPKALISIQTDANVSAFRLSGSSDAFEMSGNGETLSVGKANITADFNRVADSLFTGDMLLSLDHFKASGALGETSVQQLSVSSSTSDHGDTLASEALFTASKMASPAMPFESIEAVAFNLDFNGLDKQALIEYQNFVQQIQGGALASQQSDAAQMAKLTAILEGMLKQGLAINSKLSASLNGKPNSFTLDLALLESISLALMPLFMTQPDEALKKLDVSLSVSLDKALVDSQPMIATLIAQSPLVATVSDGYTIDLKLGNTIELNDKVMSFAELQMLAFSSLPR